VSSLRDEDYPRPNIPSAIYFDFKCNCPGDAGLLLDQLDQLNELGNNGVEGSTMAANPIPPPVKQSTETVQVNLYEAKTQLSSLVERVAKGEEIVIAKAGKPMAKLVALTSEPKLHRKPGQNLLGITYIAEDFDAPLPEDVLQDFGL
jgi:prevent-host-death family protein